MSTLVRVITFLEQRLIRVRVSVDVGRRAGLSPWYEGTNHMTPNLKMRLGFPEFPIDRQAENSTKPTGILGVAVSAK